MAMSWRDGEGMENKQQRYYQLLDVDMHCKYFEFCLYVLSTLTNVNLRFLNNINNKAV